MSDSVEVKFKGIFTAPIEGPASPERRCTCGGEIGPDITGRPMCYRCGPPAMRLMLICEAPGQPLVTPLVVPSKSELRNVKPWEEHWRVSEFNRHMVRAANGHGDVVAEIDGDERPAPYIDAQFISAAPDMARALVMLLKCSTLIGLADAKDSARAALAAAGMEPLP